jgi:hypothetical protein
LPPRPSVTFAFSGAPWQIGIDPRAAQELGRHRLALDLKAGEFARSDAANP